MNGGEQPRPNGGVVKWLLGVFTFLIGGALLSGFIWHVKTTMDNAAELKVQGALIREQLQRIDDRLKALERKRISD